MSGTETIIEISDRHVSKGLKRVFFIDSLPKDRAFELPDDDRLDSILSNIKELKDGEINKPSRIALDTQTLNISGVGYFKWYGVELPSEWKSLQTLVRYLQLMTKKLNHKHKIRFS